MEDPECIWDVEVVQSLSLDKFLNHIIPIKLFIPISLNIHDLVFLSPNF